MKIVISQNSYFLEKSNQFFGPYHSMADAEVDALSHHISKRKVDLSSFKVIRPSVLLNE